MLILPPCHPGQPRESPSSGFGLQTLLTQSHLGGPRQVMHFLICEVPTHATWCLCPRL